MAGKKLPSIDLLRQLLDCDPALGTLTWRPRPVSMFKPIDLGRWTMSAEKACGAWNKRWAAERAFTAIRRDGENSYFVGAILNQNLRAHRVIWAMTTGEWPALDIDHKNGDGLDNRFDNLRDVSNMENHRNARMSSNNTSGFNGVCWDKQTGRWRAVVKVNFRNRHLGRYANMEDAIAVRVRANQEIGFTERHGQ